MNMDISSAENLARAGVNTAEQFKIIADTFKEKEVEPKIGEAIENKLPIKEKIGIRNFKRRSFKNRKFKRNLG